MRAFQNIFTTVFLCSLIAPSTAPTRAAELTQDDINFRKLTLDKNKDQRLNYRLFVPLGYDSKRKYPLVLFLHGTAGRGSDNIKQLTGGNQLGTHVWTSREAQSVFPAFVLVPQCPTGENWSEPELNRPSSSLLLTLDALYKTQRDFSIDPDRVYVVGQSMGGLGVYSLVQNYPNLWAAAIVISAFDNFTNVLALTSVPLWVFQGDADSSVPIDTVHEMMRQLKKAGANLRYTEYHRARHEIWNRAFAEPDLLLWLMSHVRKSDSQLGSGNSPQKP
ncbi:MAG TPA: dienelactone hydrolase family protein [Dongiaceae bacterium]|nr:dienelactone hydrolase family protein [Dongiaceae bacterium]